MKYSKIRKLEGIQKRNDKKENKKSFATFAQYGIGRDTEEKFFTTKTT